MTKRFSLSRRAFLGGAAAVVSLPLLEGLGDRRAVAQPAALPKRLVGFYIPNGIHMQLWTPAETGAGYELPFILAPLANVRDKMLVLSGLANMPARPDGPGDHASGTGAFLTCAHPKKTEGSDIQNGISVDQVAANAIGEQTRIASLQLGIEGGAGVGGCDSGYSCAYARNVSWASDTQPLPKTTNPRVVFDQIFAGLDPNATAEARARIKAYRKSVLDYVVEEANSLGTKLGPTDTRKLDEYLTGIRELEMRIDAPGPACNPTEEDTTRPDDNLSFPDHVRKMLDLTVLSLQCDVTRVVTFMLGNAGSGRNYDFLGVSGGHHQISHHQSQQSNYDKLIVIDEWEVQQLAYLLEKMDAIQEGSTSLLDNSAVFFSSEISDGDRHNHDNLPVVLAGGLAGAIPGGQHIRYPDDTPLANLFITLLNGLDVPTSTFGDGNEPLSLSG